MALMGFLLGLLTGLVPLHGSPAGTAGADATIAVEVGSPDPGALTSDDFRMTPGPEEPGLVFPIVLTEPEVETGGNSAQDTGKVPAASWQAEPAIPPHLLPPVSIQPEKLRTWPTPVPRYLLHQAFLN